MQLLLELWIHKENRLELATLCKYKTGSDEINFQSWAWWLAQTRVMTGNLPLPPPTHHWHHGADNTSSSYHQNSLVRQIITSSGVSRSSLNDGKGFLSSPLNPHCVCYEDFRTWQLWHKLDKWADALLLGLFGIHRNHSNPDICQNSEPLGPLNQSTHCLTNEFNTSQLCILALTSISTFCEKLVFLMLIGDFDAFLIISAGNLVV